MTGDAGRADGFDLFVMETHAFGIRLPISRIGSMTICLKSQNMTALIVIPGNQRSRTMPDEPALKPPPEHLRPCPFCGGDNVEDDADGKRFWVSCVDCDMPGPMRRNGRDAISAWNRRDPAATPVDLKPSPAHAHLRPCPFCQSNATERRGFSAANFAIYCVSCGAMGPERATSEAACRGWNAATPIDPNDPEMVECVARALASDVFDMGDTDAVLATIVNAQWPNYADTARITLTALATRANTRKPPAE